jgi:hypothetical protein
MKRIFQILFFAIFMTSALSFAQQPQKDAEGFEPVNGDMMQRGESIPASRLVAGAYGFIFVAMLVWVASVTVRARRVEEEMDALKRKLEAKG